MNFMWSVFFGAGFTAFVYRKFGRRVGYGNTQNQIIVAVVVFIISTLVFFTILTTFLHS
jgi:hypothetical protein